jgi:hypothetical protein
MPIIHPDPAVMHMLYCTAHQCADLPQFVAIMQTGLVLCLLSLGALTIVFFFHLLCAFLSSR